MCAPNDRAEEQGKKRKPRRDRIVERPRGTARLHDSFTPLEVSTCRSLLRSRFLQRSWTILQAVVSGTPERKQLLQPSSSFTVLIAAPGEKGPQGQQSAW